MYFFILAIPINVSESERSSLKSLSNVSSDSKESLSHESPHHSYTTV